MSSGCCSLRHRGDDRVGHVPDAELVDLPVGELALQKVAVRNRIEHDRPLELTSGGQAREDVVAQVHDPSRIARKYRAPGHGARQNLQELAKRRERLRPQHRNVDHGAGVLRQLAVEALGRPAAQPCPRCNDLLGSWGSRRGRGPPPRSPRISHRPRWARRDRRTHGTA